MNFYQKGVQMSPLNKVIGVWKLQSVTNKAQDSSISSTEDEWQMMKIITKTHFMFAEQDPKRPKFIHGGTDSELLETAKSFFAGAGTYTFDGTFYTEKIDIFFNPNYIGQTVTYNCEFKDNLMTQSGTFPVKSIGLPGEDIELCETWGSRGGSPFLMAIKVPAETGYIAVDLCE